MPENSNKQKEFLDFLRAEEREPPPEVAQAVRSRLSRRLKWERPLVLGKFCSSHLLIAALTLSFCPQFGLGPFLSPGSSGHGISHHFMQIGPWACAIFCAFVFFASGLFVSKLILKRNEARRLAQTPWYVAVIYCASILILFLSIGDRSEEQTMFFEPEYIVIWFLTGLMILLSGLRMHTTMHAPSQPS